MFDVSDAFSVREFRKLIASDPKDNEPKVSFFFLSFPCASLFEYSFHVFEIFILSYVVE